MDGYDLFLAITKFSAILVATVFGIVGILHEFKDDDGRVTWWGKFALWGGGISALLSAAAQGCEVLKARSDAEMHANEVSREIDDSRRLMSSVSETLSKTAVVLAEVERSRELVDLDAIQLDFELSFSIKDQAFNAYRDRLDAKCRELLNEMARKKRDSLQSTADGIEIRQNNGRRVFRIVQSSLFWPDPHDTREADAVDAVGSFYFETDFEHPKFEHPDSQVKIIFSDGLNLPLVDGKKKASAPIEDDGYVLANLYYDIDRGRLTLYVHRANGRCVTEANEAFLSIVDFETSKLFVSLDAARAKNAPSISIDNLKFNFGSKGRPLFANGDVSKVTTDQTVEFQLRLASHQTKRVLSDAGWFRENYGVWDPFLRDRTK